MTTNNSKGYRQRKTRDPCISCRMHLDNCICYLIPKLELATRVSLVIHYKELKRTTNTGRLASLGLNNSSITIRGQSDEALDLSPLILDTYFNLLLYPSSEAIELTGEFVKNCEKPLHLIVPDGNWRQASKVHYRHSELKNLPRIKITAKSAFAVHLRRESTEFGMATLEAIVKALEIIEGEDRVAPLRNLYAAKLHRTLTARGLRPLP